MNKLSKASDDSGSFDRFKRLTKALVVVPRHELKDKLDKYRRQKHKAKKKTA